MPVKLTRTVSPLHCVTFATGFISTVFVMLMINVREVPGQVPPVGCTVTVAVPKAVALKPMFPVPVAAKPMVVLLFDQL